MGFGIVLLGGVLALAVTGAAVGIFGAGGLPAIPIFFASGIVGTFAVAGLVARRGQLREAVDDQGIRPLAGFDGSG